MKFYELLLEQEWSQNLCQAQKDFFKNIKHFFENSPSKSPTCFNKFDAKNDMLFFFKKKDEIENGNQWILLSDIG